MKKFIFAMVAMIATMSMYAQHVESQNFIDNTAVSIKGGISGLTCPEFNGYENFGHSLQASVGVGVEKWITPIWGFGIDGTFGITNGSSKGAFQSGNWFNYVTVMGQTKLNLTTLCLGYTGEPRKFELIPSVGIGWIHGFYRSTLVEGTYTSDANDLGTKFSVDFKYNVTPRLSVVATPYFAYNLTNEHASKHHNSMLEWQPRFDVRNSWYGLEVGVSYRLGNTFKVCNKTHTQAEVDALNAEINELREKLEKKPTTVTVVQYIDKAVVETVDNNYTVLFKQGKSDVGDLSDIAKKLNKTDASITIVGSTSPEGSEKFNRNLALARANAVKDALVKAGVDKDRITVTNEYGKQRNATIILSK